MNKQPEVTEATRKRIILAFWTLYQHNRIEKVTVSAITKEAHIHRSTFYKYFADVYELLDAFEADLLDYIENEYARKCLMTSPINYDILLPIVSVVYQNGMERLHYLLGPAGDPGFREKLLKRMRPYFFNVTATSSEDPYCDLKMSIVFNSLLTVINYWYDHKETMTMEEVLQLLKPFLVILNITE